MMLLVQSYYNIKQTYGRTAGVTRVNAIPDQMEIIRAVWANKHSGNPSVNAGMIPELKGIETAAKLVAKFLTKNK